MNNAAYSSAAPSGDFTTPELVIEYLDAPGDGAALFTICVVGVAAAAQPTS
jgi:hypothetical protein